MKITRSHAEYWAARKAPKFIQQVFAPNPTKVKLGWDTTVTVNDLINAQSSRRMTDGELATHNTLAFVRGWHRRGEDIRAKLAELRDSPHFCPNKPKRTSLCIKWLKKLSPTTE